MKRTPLLPTKLGAPPIRRARALWSWLAKFAQMRARLQLIEISSELLWFSSGSSLAP